MAKMQARQMVYVFRRAGTALRAGLDTRQVWNREAERSAFRQRAEFDRIADYVARGDTIASAMRAANGFFPPLAVELIDVGEQTGKLDEVLLRLADHYEYLLSLRRQFVLSLLWPLAELSLALLVVGFFIWLMGVLTPAGSEPIRIFGLAGTSGLAIYLAVVLGAIGLLTLGTMAIWRGWFGTLPLQLAMRIPVVGKTLETSAISRLSWCLATALESGVDARRSMALALRSTQNPIYTSQTDLVDEQILHGREFHESLRATGVFPREFLELLETAEISGTHHESLLALSRDYQQRANSAMRVLVGVASFVLWILVGGLILVILYEFISEIYLKRYLGTVNELLKEV